MRKEIVSFMDFIRKHGVVGLAVGLAIGLQVTSTVDVIVKGFIDPVVGFIIGDTEGLSAATWTIEAGDRVMVLQYGAVLSALITLLAVAAVVYYSIKLFKLDKLDKVDNASKK